MEAVSGFLYVFSFLLTCTTSLLSGQETQGSYLRLAGIGKDTCNR